jgi:hypothetical protein
VGAPYVVVVKSAQASRRPYVPLWVIQSRSMRAVERGRLMWVFALVITGLVVMLVINLTRDAIRVWRSRSQTADK